MIIALVKKLTFFADTSAIDSYHYTMFHGIATRGGDKSAPQHLFIDQQPRTPLSLSVNAYKLHHLIQPGVNLIVSELLMQPLASIPNINFINVKIQKIVNIAYREFDFNRRQSDRKGIEDQAEEEILTAERIDGPCCRIGDYFELLCPRYFDVCDGFDRKYFLRQSIGPTKWDPKVEAWISAEMIRSFPLLWLDGCFIVGDLVYTVIKDHLTSPYFQVFEFRIDL